MSPETVTLAAQRISEHVAKHGVEEVHAVLHGGEPLLAGHQRLGEIIRTLRDRLDDVCRLHLRIHTNGVTLDERFCDLFALHGVKVGVSLDGDRLANDRHRRYRNGRSSHGAVIRAVELLRARPDLYGGLLCTIDVANDPIVVYEALLALEPPKIDFLLPHATWEAPPPHWPAPVYADWLIKIFDRWAADGRPVSVRLFESIIRTTYGMPSLTEAIGNEPSAVVVIETDGAYEQVDSMKVTYDGAPATGRDLARHSLDEVAAHPGIAARRQGLSGLCEECRQCPVVTTCGGGLYPHRFRAGSFSNPSVYCADLLKLITRIQNEPAGPSHSLPISALDALAAGFGGPQEIARLTEAQVSICRGLLAALPARTSEAWDLAIRLDRECPDTLGAVLAHPYVRTWAISCLRGEGRPGYLANVVAAAAVRAGMDVRLVAETVAGAVHLPGVGTLDGETDGQVVLVIRAGEISLDGQAASLRPTARLTSGQFSVALEDADPYRDCHQWPATGRLTAGEIAEWQHSFDAAWQLIQSDYPAYAPGLRAGLSTLMPLAAPSTGREVSSAARQAFGSVAAALPRDPATLALLIIHEFQHVKMGALLDMFDLYDDSDTTLYHAPWRADPRPLEALLQGTYAHIAVSDFWRTRRHTAHGIDREAARKHFAHWHAHTIRAVETLASSGKLTPLGERCVTRMGETLARWTDEREPKET